MAQVTEYAVPGSPLTMSELKTSIDDMLEAAVSGNRGSTAPSNPVVGMIWWDTSGDPVEVLKAYRAEGWRSILSYNNTTGAITLMSNINGTALATAFALTILDDADASAVLTTLGISTFVKTLLDDASASAFLTTLGVTTFVKTILDDADAAAALTTLGVSAFAQTILDDANAAAALTTLGVSAFAQTILDDANAAAARATLGALASVDNNVLTGNMFLDVTAGTDVILGSAGTARSTSNTSYTELKRLTPIKRSGTVTVSFDLAVAGAARIYVNDVPVGTERTAVAIWEENITVNYGDVISIWGKRASSTNAKVASVSVTSADPYCAKEVSGY